MEAGYIVNIKSKEIHDAGHLKEECNTDDIVAEHKDHAGAERFAELLTEGGWRLCGHCMQAKPAE